YTLIVLPLPVVPPALAIYPLNGNYTTEDLLRRPAIKGVAHNVELVDGPYNVPDGAYQFKGQANSYIEFPNGNLILDAKYSITLMCWVKPGGKDGPLFNYNKNDWGVHIWLAQAGRFFVRITKAGSHAFHPFVQTVNPLPIGKWAHVAATYDFNTGYNAIYVDGVLQAPSKNVGRGSPSIPISTNDPEVRMGARLSDGRYFNGAICQMGIWNVALTQEQIAVEMMRKKGNFKACARMSANLSYLHMGYRSLEIPHFHIDLNAYSIRQPKPCDINPCEHGGKCMNVGNSFKCLCSKGYTGRTCAQGNGDLCLLAFLYDIDIDECAYEKGGCQDICVNTVGSSYCSCSDPEFSLAPDKRHCIAEGVEVDCGQNDMKITLPKSLLKGLDRQHLRLIDVSCRAYENKTHYFLQTQLTGCKTKLRQKGDFFVYTNMVSEIPIKENQIVTRVREAMIPFFCCYSKWGVVSSVGLKPMSKKVIFSSKGFGKFTIFLKLFNKPTFENPFSPKDFPVMFTIRERMYFELHVDTEDRRLAIFALDCFATPSQDRNALPRYDVIKDGCAVDNTVEFHHPPNPQNQRFSLEAFQYVGKHPYVFMHCRVKICNATDPNSRCARGCVKRELRSVETLHETADNVYSLAQGPLTLDREKRVANADEAVKSDQSTHEAERSLQLPVVIALAVVIGVCLVGISYLVWQKKRVKAFRQYKQLYVDSRN
ncbi:unnamed protein product, partial [Porites lobata]